MRRSYDEVGGPTLNRVERHDRLMWFCRWGRFFGSGKKIVGKRELHGGCPPIPIRWLRADGVPYSCRDQRRVIVSSMSNCSPRSQLFL